MTDTKVVKLTKAAQLAADTRSQIETVAAQATDAEKELVAAIITRAQTGKRDVGLYTLTPAMCAILFLQHNEHNRDWRIATCIEYARRMTAGQWAMNGDTIRFYIDGVLSDGQHRLSSAAVAAHTLTDQPIAFGIHRGDIDTVDDGVHRHASDAAKLHGKENHTVKQYVVTKAAAYLLKAGEPGAQLRGAREILNAIILNDSLLDEAIQIGNRSRQKIVGPVFDAPEAHTIAYLMLTTGWPTQRVIEKLTFFQSGVTTQGDKDPFFVAGNIIRIAKEKDDAKTHLSTLKQLGVALYAMLETERGVTAIGAGTVKAAVKKQLPHPAYPTDPAEPPAQQNAAAA